ncbi:MAG: CvpA family protein [Burkholderiales bacterium]|nr:CvpA family protein [Burkholderiales bacterium]
MNELDYAIIAVVLVSLGVGAWRGAIREVINIAGWVLAFFLAHALSATLAPYFADWMAEPVYRSVVAWIVIFVAVLIFAALLACLLSELVRKLGLSGLDRVLGAMVGLLRGGLVVIVLALAAGMTKFPDSALWKNAALTPPVEVAALYARALLPQSLAAKISYRSPATAKT